MISEETIISVCSSNTVGSDSLEVFLVSRYRGQNGIHITAVNILEN